MSFSALIYDFPEKNTNIMCKSTALHQSFLIHHTFKEPINDWFQGPTVQLIM